MQSGLTDQESREPASRHSSRHALIAFARNPIVSIPYGLSVAFALFVPSDALDRWSSLGSWVMFVEQYVPIVSNYAARSVFPQVTAAYFSVVIGVITPTVVWGVLTTPGFVINEEKFGRLQQRFGILHSLISWVVALGLLPFLAYFCLMINPGYDFNIMPINQSRIALAVFGPLFAGGIAGGCIAASLKVLHRLVSKG